MSRRRGNGLAPPRFDLRWLLGSPLLVAGCAAGVAATIVLGRALDALHDSDRIRAELEATAATMVAEAAAADFVASGGVATTRTVDLGGGIVVSTAASRRASTASVDLVAIVAGRQLAFEFPVLAGGVPAAFGRPLTAVEGGPELPAGWSLAERIARADLPPTDLSAGTVVRESLLALQLELDPGIALLQLGAGTDRLDFVMGSRQQQAGPITVAEARVVVIDGNLWIERGPTPLRLRLDASLTLVVRGNAYVGRSIEVEGPGRLTIATACLDGTSFADRDGNGRWSDGDELRSAERFRGPLEGAGSVYLGALRRPGGTLSLQLTMFVAGELHLAVELAEVEGSVLLCHGGTVLPGGGRLVVRHAELPDLERASVPGFATIGAPRPGRLRPLPAGEQSLYPAGLTR